MNHKRVYRLYCLEGLRMRPQRPRRHVSSRRREIRPLASRPDERWAMDFMSDEIFDGRRIRLLTLVDHFTRESLAIEVDGSLGGQQASTADPTAQSHPVAGCDGEATGVCFIQKQRDQ